MTRAAIEAIEVAYHADGTTEEWLRAIARAMPSRRDGRGYLCATYHITPTGHLVFDDMIQHGASGDLVTPTRASATAANMTPEYVARVFATVTCAAALSYGPPETRKVTRTELPRSYGELGIRDIVAVNGIDPTRHGVWVAGMLGVPAELKRREQSIWSRVAAHLAASYRLRRARAGEPDAVITPDGKVEHAIDDARSISARASLRAAALAIDRARTRRSRLDEVEAVAIWQALVSGRWTLVDRVDSDGRRYFIARKNDPDVARHHELTRRERQIAGYAALGHSNKLIAYELGLSVSAVAVYLTSAMHKLGVASRTELILVAHAFGGEREVMP